jgi:hypothetical protein
MISFKKYIELIKEDNVSGGEGVFGNIDGSSGYNGSDPRIPFVIGSFRRNGKKRKRKNKRKKKFVSK